MSLSQQERKKERKKIEIGGRFGAESENRHRRSSSPGLDATSSQLSSVTSSRRDPYTQRENTVIANEEDEEHQPLVRYDDIEKFRSELRRVELRIEKLAQGEEAGGIARSKTKKKRQREPDGSVPLSCSFSIQQNQQDTTSGGGGGEQTFKTLVSDGSLGLEKGASAEDDDDEADVLPKDSYSFIILSKMNSLPFVFACFVWIVQVAVLSMVAVDQVNLRMDNNPFQIPGNVDIVVRVTQALAILVSLVFSTSSLSDLLASIDLYLTIKVDPKETTEDTRLFKRVAFQALLRFVQGTLGVVVMLLLIVQSTTNFDLVLNFTAVEFLSELDNISFELATRDYFGTIIRSVALKIKEKKFVNGYYLDRNSNTFGWKTRSIRLLVVSLVGCFLYGTFIAVAAAQENGRFLCQTLQVEFGDEIVPILGALNGIYDITDKQSEGRRLIYKQQNFEDNSGLLGYCSEENAWTSYSGEDPCDFHAKSSETSTYEVETTWTDAWYSKNDEPIDFVKISCLNYYYGDVDREETKNDYVDVEIDSCTQVYHDLSSSTSNEALIFSDANLFEVVANKFSHNQPIYRAHIEKPKLAISVPCTDTAKNESWSSYEEVTNGGDIESTDCKFYCHAWFNPLADTTVEETICIPDNNQLSDRDRDKQLWDTDVCGCCGDCPDIATAPQRSWLDWIGHIGENSRPDDVISEFVEDDDDYYYITDKFLLDDSTSDDECVLQGLSAYLIFSGRRWLHIVSDSLDLCSEFHAEELKSLNPYVTYVSEPVDFDSSKYQIPGALEWFLTQPDEDVTGSFPRPDVLRPINTRFLCMEQLEVSDLLPANTIPVQIGKLSRLQVLDLKNQNLIGTIPSEVGYLTNLRILNLNGNQLSGDIPSDFANLMSLDYVMQLNNLKSLTVRGMRGQGTISSKIGQLTNLRSLVVSGPGYPVGTIPPEIGQMKSLILDRHDMTGPIPTQLANLELLEHLEMVNFGSGLNGTIPTEIGLMTSLKLIILDFNQLNDPIPPEMGQLSAVSILSLYDNILEKIPADLGNMTSLRKLSLAENRLQGTIPSQLGLLSNLEILDIYNNGLTGSIPPELGTLTNLREVYLWENELTGSLPFDCGDGGLQIFGTTAGNNFTNTCKVDWVKINVSFACDFFSNDTYLTELFESVGEDYEYEVLGYYDYEWLDVCREHWGN